MPHDDSTWVIHSLPRAGAETPRAQPAAPRLAFQSVLSPWRQEARPAGPRREPEPVRDRPGRFRRTAG